MNYVNLGKSGVKVSPLCLGTMMFGAPTSEADSARIIARALDAGINFIDTADVYNNGDSERITGRALKGKRPSVVLATKFRNAMGTGPNDGGAGRIHVMRALEASLQRMGTDYIDLYYLHRPEQGTPLEETLRALDDCVRQGKVRYIACSNLYAWQVMDGLAISQARNLDAFACVQPLYNIVNRDAELELFPLCMEKGLGAVIYSPLARGVLAAKYRRGQPAPEGSRAARGDRRILQTELREESFDIAEKLDDHAKARGTTLTRFSLAWALANKAVTAAIVGPRIIDQLDDNLKCLEVKIGPEDETLVDGLVPKGWHTGKGYNDPQYPVAGRFV